MVFQITNGAMSSSLIINTSDANSTLHNGIYTCQVTLTVDRVDDFTTTSNIAIVGLQGTVQWKYTHCVIIHTLSMRQQKESVCS